MVTLKLVEDKQWHLDEPLYHYWIDPDVADDSLHKKLTTRHVLSHQTGLPNWRWMHPSKKLAFDFEPGEGYNYSGEGFVYLARALENKFKKSLAELFRSQNLATLSTHHAGQPYASLVAFAASDDLRQIYFATPTTTRKYANLSADSRVAVLVNSSMNQTSDFHRAISVTAVGKATDVTGKNRPRILGHYLAKHPYLEDFVHSPTCALVQVTVDSYYMVKNFQN